MTQSEVRAFLTRCDPGALRVRARISLRTVAAATRASGPGTVHRWENRHTAVPHGAPGAAYCRFIAGLARHEAVKWDDDPGDAVIGAPA